MHLAASKFVYNLADKNLLAVFRRIFWVLCIALLRELFKSSFMLRQLCLVIVWYNSERKNYCFSGTLCEAMSPVVVIGFKDFKPEGILIVIKADTCIYKKCSLSSSSCVSPLISAELKHKKYCREIKVSSQQLSSLLCCSVCSLN